MAQSDPPGSRGHDKDLSSGPIASTLLIFALPVLGSNLLQSINGSINAVWVGRLLGPQALAATANANLVMMLLLGAVFGVGMAATILIGQSIGRNDLAGARRVVGTGTSFFLVVSIGFSLAGLIWADDILALLGTPADALPLARDYMRMIFIAMPAMNLLSFLMSILRGAGDSRTPFLFMALSVVLDIVLNPLLISGLGPFPALGIAGSGWSTLIGQTVSAMALLAVIYRRQDPLRLAGADLALLRPDLTLVRLIVTKGIPIGLQMTVISLAALTLMGMVNQAGSTVTAAYGVAAQLWTYVQMPAMAVGAAVSAMAAQSVGAGRWGRVRGITRVGLAANLVLTSVLVALVYLFERPVLGLFLGADSAAIDLAVHINRDVVWSFVLFGLTFVLFSTVRATGAVMPPLLILVISMLGVRTGFAWWMRDSLGLDALWLSFAVGNGCSLILAALYYRFGGWRNTTMTVPRHQAAPAPAASEAVAPAVAAMAAPDTAPGVVPTAPRSPQAGPQPRSRTARPATTLVSALIIDARAVILVSGQPADTGLSLPCVEAARILGRSAALRRGTRSPPSAPPSAPPSVHPPAPPPESRR